MRRLPVWFAALVIAAMPIVSVAAQAPAGPTTTSKPKSIIANGAVTAVTLDSLTVKGKAGEWKFTVDKDTSVTARGATHKSLALKKEEKASTLTEYIKVGADVSVTYHEMGANKIAESIRVLGAVPIK
jgi:hypothetical protein